MKDNKSCPDDDVYNGDIGILEEVIPAKDSINNKTTLIVNYQGVYVEYTEETWDNIALAYCITVHKSQGSEYPIVIFPFTWRMKVMLQRKLIYTGVTRARKALVLLGELSALEYGIQLVDTHVRNTTLQMRMQDH